MNDHKRNPLVKFWEKILSDVIHSEIPLDVIALNQKVSISLEQWNFIQENWKIKNFRKMWKIYIFLQDNLNLSIIFTGKNVNL